MISKKVEGSPAIEIGAITQIFVHSLFHEVSLQQLLDSLLGDLKCVVI